MLQAGCPRPHKTPVKAEECAPGSGAKAPCPVRSLRPGYVEGALPLQRSALPLHEDIGEQEGLLACHPPLALLCCEAWQNGSGMPGVWKAGRWAAGWAWQELFSTGTKKQPSSGCMTEASASKQQDDKAALPTSPAYLPLLISRESLFLFRDQLGFPFSGKTVKEGYFRAQGHRVGGGTYKRQAS